MPPRGSAALGAGAVGLAVVSWGFVGIVVKLATLGGLAVSFWRLWLGSAVMVAIAVALRRRPSLDALARSALGGVLFAADVALFFSALKLTSVANATLITALQPALVLVVAGPWFGERVGLADVGWTALAVGGVGLVVVGASGSPAWSPAGDGIAFLALLAWTGYWLASKHARRTLGTIEYMTGVQLVAAIALTPVVLLAGPGLRPPAGGDWLWVAVLVLGPGVTGQSLAAWAHRWVDVTASSLMTLGVPVVAAAAGLVFLGERLHPLQIAGGLVVLTAIGAIIRRSRTGAPATEEVVA